MAELVDATDSKSVVRKNVGVQVPLSAPKSVAETPVRVSAKETWFLCKKRTGTAGCFNAWLIIFSLDQSNYFNLFQTFWWYR